MADCKELCTFYFPAVIRQDNIVIGLTASGQDHAGVKNAAAKLRLHIDEILDHDTEPINASSKTANFELVPANMGFKIAIEKEDTDDWRFNRSAWQQLSRN